MSKAVCTIVLGITVYVLWIQLCECLMLLNQRSINSFLLMFCLGGRLSIGLKPIGQGRQDSSATPSQDAVFLLVVTGGYVLIRLFDKNPCYNWLLPRQMNLDCGIFSLTSSLQLRYRKSHYCLLAI
jgi:hypothetical protein